MHRTMHPRVAAATWLAVIVIVVVIVIVAGPLAGSAQATVPATMSYQGMLRDPGGAIPPDGQHAFVFRVFNVESGGSALWQESQTLVVTGGIFNATLGAVTPLTLPFDVQYWLETTVDSGTLAPRVKLASAPYAQRAAVAEALAGGGGGGDITAVYADDGLTGGATSGDAHLAVGAGTGITVSADQVRLSDAYVSGTAYDSRFVNEGQTNSVTADMIAPNVVASVDGVVNDGGNIDLIAGSNVTITPDDVNNTITISATGGGGGIGGSGTTGYVPKFTGMTTLGNSLAYDTGYGIGIGTTTSSARLGVAGSTQGSGWVEITDEIQPRIEIKTPNLGGNAWLGFNRGGSPKAMLFEDASGLYLTRYAESGGIRLQSTTADAANHAAVTARWTGSSMNDYIGIYGESNPMDYYGIGGSFKGGYVGAQGIVWPTGAGYYYGVEGVVEGGSGNNNAVYGYASGSGTNCAIYGEAIGGSINYAGFFQGDVEVLGNLTVTGSKSFRIDHPLDPANKYLNHFCIESDEVLNTYSGNAVLNAYGEAWVELADWFDAVNRDPRYQLTCVGGHAPVYVAEKITGNRFKIAGGTPGLEVSWQVTAVRSDPAMAKYRMPVEQEKPAPERGKYLDPDLYGASESLRIGRIEQKTQR